MKFSPLATPLPRCTIDENSSSRLGCVEFWQLNSKLYEIDVSTPDGKTITYHRGQRIPLNLWGGEAGVDEIFEGAED